MPLHSFTPDPARTVNAYGALSRQRIERLRGEFAQLIKLSAEPIAIRINSPGGKIDFIHAFQDTLFSRQPHERSLPLITIAREHAGSSAAYLLILGDYAYAHAYSKLLLHGVGYFSIKKNLKVTREETLIMASRLNDKNQAIALKLTRRVTRRLAFKHHRLASSNTQGNPATWLRAFYQVIASRLMAEKSKVIFHEAFGYYHVLVPANNVLGGEDYFQEWIQGRLACDQQKENKVGGAEALDLAIDITNVRAVTSPEFGRWLTDLTQTHGQFLFSAKEAAVYNRKNSSNNSAAQAYRTKIAAPRMTLLARFAYALCWRLLMGENEITAPDAYWLGLVDEVIDSKLTGERLQR